MTEKSWTDPKHLHRGVYAATLADLGGDRPMHHASSPGLTPRGYRRIRRYQVWVERATSRLWYICEVRYYRKHATERRVVLSPYKGRREYCVEVSDAFLFSELQVWDEAIKERGSADETK